MAASAEILTSTPMRDASTLTRPSFAMPPGRVTGMSTYSSKGSSTPRSRSRTTHCLTAV